MNEWDAQMLHLQWLWGEQYGRSSEALLGRAANTVCVVWANNRLFTWYSCTHVEVCICKAQNVYGCPFPNQITAMATSSNQVEISISPRRWLCSVWLASSCMTLNERIDQAPCDSQYLGAYCVVRSHLDVCTRSCLTHRRDAVLFHHDFYSSHPFFTYRTVESFKHVWNTAVKWGCFQNNMNRFYLSMIHIQRAYKRMSESIVLS